MSCSVQFSEFEYHFCAFADLAVGAPYEGHGAVYIFHGGHDGLQSEPSQRIYAGQLPSLVQPLRTFGHALSAGMDMDLNGYPDMVVGAFGVDRLVMLRSRPVINVRSTIESTPASIQPRVAFSIELELCFQFTTKPRDRSVTLLELHACSVVVRIDPLCFVAGCRKR